MFPHQRWKIIREIFVVITIIFTTPVEKFVVMKHFLRHCKYFFRNKETSHLQKWHLGQFIIPYGKQNKIPIFLFFSLLIFQSKICLGVHTYDPALILNIIPPYRKRGVLRHGKCCDPGWNSEVKICV